MAAALKIYSPSTVDSALYKISNKAFPSSEDLAAAQAYQRHGIYTDNQHTHISSNGGVHTNLAAISNSAGKQQLVVNTENDLWDAVSTVTCNNIYI